MDLWIQIEIVKVFSFLFHFLIPSLFFFKKKKLIIKSKECDATCSKCNGPTSTNCLECSNQKFLFSGECLDECPIGYFSNPTLNKCQGILFFTW